MTSNLDPRVVEDFGAEWARFDQSDAPEPELLRQFERYFAVFPWHIVGPSSSGFDLGCGSGRWAQFVAPRVGQLACVDASERALDVARHKLASQSNCTFHAASVDRIPLADESMDFGYSLGVLHHVPETAKGIASCVSKLKRGAPMLLYLYYALDNRPWWFRFIWRISNGLRRVIAASPGKIKQLACDIIAAIVYWPFARIARLSEKLGMNPNGMLLSQYRSMSFYTMRTDALDRFGTRLEQRFTREEISKMMLGAGLERIEFSDSQPYWCAVGYRR